MKAKQKQELSMRTASQLDNGESSTIVDVDYNHPSAKRLIELGFTPGQNIELIGKSLFKDPIAFSIRGTVIAVRKNEASCIKVR